MNKLTPLEAELAEMSPASGDELLKPNWDIADGSSESWADQVPEGLREIWSELSVEAKLVAAIVGVEGIRTWDIE